MFQLAIKNLSKLAPFAGGPWNLPHKFHLYIIDITYSMLLLVESTTWYVYPPPCFASFYFIFALKSCQNVKKVLTSFGVPSTQMLVEIHNTCAYGSQFFSRIPLSRRPVLSLSLALTCGSTPTTCSTRTWGQTTWKTFTGLPTGKT